MNCLFVFFFNCFGLHSSLSDIFVCIFCDRYLPVAAVSVVVPLSAAVAAAAAADGLNDDGFHQRLRYSLLTIFFVFCFLSKNFYVCQTVFSNTS